MWNYLYYAWRVALNVFYVAVVLYVVNQLQSHRPEAMMISAIGLVYIAVRLVGIGLFFATIETNTHLARIRELLGDESTKHENLWRTIVGLYIDLAFLCLIGLILVLGFFPALPS